MYTQDTKGKTKKTVCQVIRDTMSWMEEENLLEQRQVKADEQYRDDNDRPRNWDMMSDEDPSDMMYSI